VPSGPVTLVSQLGSAPQAPGRPGWGRDRRWPWHSGESAPPGRAGAGSLLAWPRGGRPRGTAAPAAPPPVPASFPPLAAQVAPGGDCQWARGRGSDADFGQCRRLGRWPEELLSGGSCGCATGRLHTRPRACSCNLPVNDRMPIPSHHDRSEATFLPLQSEPSLRVLPPPPLPSWLLPRQQSRHVGLNCCRVRHFRDNRPYYPCSSERAEGCARALSRDSRVHRHAGRP
jgi:hypothetical protein